MARVVVQHTPEQKASISRTKSKGGKRRWAKYHKNQAKFIEKDVEQINDYCGIITMSQLKELNG